jgi:hypothetical protein
LSTSPICLAIQIQFYTHTLSPCVGRVFRDCRRRDRRARATKIIEEGLFTAELGSVPFYRYNEQIRLNASRGFEMNETNETFKGIKGDTKDSDTL